MKRIFLFSAIALLAVVSCSEKGGLQEGFNSSDQIAIAPVSADGNVATRGYVEAGEFAETYWSNLHKATKPVATPRTMQISAYLYPQNGAEGNYFVGTTFAKGESDGFWHANPAIYWPVGGKLDFLAFSLTTEEGCSKNVNVKWDSENAASKVTLTVPAENTQNDILYASAANVKAKKEAEAISMKFNHAQAWLEFQLTGTPANVVRVKSIEIEDAYNAGVLTINNNSGNPLAQWDFAGQKAQNIPVDNKYNVCKLTESAQFMDMLIPEQSKTTFVIYYVLSADDDVDMNDPDNILSYRFTTDQKTWLAGEKYIYKININTNEVTVHPEVAAWKPTTVTESKVKVEYDEEIGSVTIESLDDMAAAAPIQTVEGTCKTWGGRVKLTAKVNDAKAGEYRFEKWSDGSTENPHIVTVTEDVTYKAFFTNGGYTINVVANEPECGKVTINGREVSSMKVAPGEKVTIKAIPTNPYIFIKWLDEDTNAEREITVNNDILYKAMFGFTITVKTSDSSMGTVIVKDGNNVVLTGVSDIYTVIGKTAKLEAKKNEGYEFWRWSDGYTSGSTRTISPANGPELIAFFGLRVTAQVRNEKYLQVSFDNENWFSYKQAVFEELPVTVYVKPVDGKGAKFYKWIDKDSKKISSAATLEIDKPQNKTVTAIDINKDAISSEFSVSATKKVCFSPGNLQAKYNGSAYSWGFAEEQYSFIGNKAGNTNIGSHSNGDVVDLFGWSARLYVDPNWGISDSMVDDTYLGLFEEWGKNISVGEYDSKWYTLTKDEWDYLLSRRKGETYEELRVLVYVESGEKKIKGLLLYPDDYTGTIALDNTVIDVIPTGAVFLPYAGERKGNVVTEGVGNYWSGTNNGDFMAYRLGLSTQVWWPSSINRYNGHSVRLVSEIKGK